MPRTNNSSQTKTKKPTKAANTFELTCFKCGGSLNLDLDNMQSFCPYCGEKLMIETNQLSKILSEKEKTKRLQMELDKEERNEIRKHQETKWENMMIVGVFGFIVFMSLVAALVLFLPDANYNRKVKKQEKHLESIVQEIKDDKDKKDYDSALYKANQLYYVPIESYSSEEELIKEKWDKIRESTIKMIEEAKAKDSGSSTAKTAVIFKGGGSDFSRCPVSTLILSA